jgi:hypothetical protein
MSVGAAANYKIVIHSVLPDTVGRVVMPRDQRSLRGFAFDSSQLTAEHERAIESLAREILRSWHSRSRVIRIQVDGHTDPVGTADYNRGLGLRRAQAVAARLSKLLSDGAGDLPAGTVDQIAFVVNSFGKERPISTRLQALNRRVEITLFLDTTPPQVPLSLDPTVTLLQGVVAGADPDAAARIRCLLQKIRDPNTDDRFVNETQVFLVNRDKAMPGPTEWSRVRNLVLSPDLFDPSRSDAQVLANIGRIDEDIIYGVRKMNQMIAYASGIPDDVGLGTLAPAFKELNKWVIDRLSDPHSVYTCYPELHP